MTAENGVGKNCASKDYDYDYYLRLPVRHCMEGRTQEAKPVQGVRT